MFKVGQSVVCVRGTGSNLLTAGKSYKVWESEPKYVRVRTDNLGIIWFLSNRFRVEGLVKKPDIPEVVIRDGEIV